MTLIPALTEALAWMVAALARDHSQGSGVKKVTITICEYFWYILYITCCLYLLNTFPNISVLCNDTAVCEPQEFCSVTGTKYGESNGICQTGNIKIRTILLLAMKFIYRQLICTNFFSCSYHRKLRRLLDTVSRGQISILL